MPRLLRVFAVIALCVCAFLPAVHGGEKIRVALAAPPEGDASAVSALAVSSRIEEQLLNSGFFDVVDRSEASVAAALEEIQFTNDFSFQPDGTQSDRPEFGKVADAGYLVFVTLESSRYQKIPRAQYKTVKVPDQEIISYTLGLRIIDVESMRIVYARTDDYQYSEKDPVNALAKDAVTKVVDALYPFQIVARMGERLYFNRGTETNVDAGTRLELFQAAAVPDSATGNVLTVEMPVAEVTVDRAQAWVSEAVLSDPALMATLSETTRAKALPPPAAPPPDIPTPEAPTLDW